MLFLIYLILLETVIMGKKVIVIMGKKVIVDYIEDDWSRMDMRDFTVIENIPFWDVSACCLAKKDIWMYLNLMKLFDFVVHCEGEGGVLWVACVEVRCAG